MGKTILITGASDGIGEATAKYLADKGYRLVLVARREEKLRALAEHLPTNSLVIPFDLMDLDRIEEIFIRCREENFTLDGMVHSAGVNHDLPIRVNDVALMQQVTTINYFAFVELAKNFHKRKYSNDSASIVAISSTASLKHDKGMCTYSASKSALNSSIKTMAKEFMKRKHRANAILPAFVNTPMAEQADIRFGDLADKLKGQPLGFIEPEYISYLIEFLLSEKAKYITGALIPVSAGMVLY